MRDLLLLIIAMALSGCGIEVTPPRWNACAKLCEPNDGIYYCYMGVFETKCVCGDGAIFENFDKKK